MPGQQNPDDANDFDEVGEPSSRERSRVLRRILTGVAVTALGVWSPYLLITIGVLLLLIVAHEAGHYAAARMTGMKAPEFMVGFGPELFSVRRGETTWGLRAIPLGGYVRIIGMNDLEQVDAADEERTYRAKATWKRIVVSFAGPAANLLCAVLLLAVTYGAFGLARETLRIGEVRAGTPAAAAGIRSGDVITALDGTAVEDMAAYREMLQGTQGEVTVDLDRAGVPVEVTLTPVSDQGRKVIGVLTESERERLPVHRAAAKATTDTVTWTGRTFVAVAGVFASIGTYIGALFTDSVPDDKRLLSPVGVSQVAQNQAIDVPWVLGFAAIINISLATFNLFPVPPLDGGHILVASVEGLLSKLRRKRTKLSPRVLQPVTFVVWSALILLGISTLWLDVTQPLRLP